MTNLADVFQPRGVAAPTVVQGYIAAVYGADVYAILPSFDTTHRWGPLLGADPAGLARGDDCLVAFDEDREPWLVNPAAGGEGPPGPKGDTGPTGATGATGAAGAKGDAGGLVYSAMIGNGSASSFTLTHGFNSRNVTVAIYRTAAPYDDVQADVERTDANTVTVRTLPTIPATNEYTVVVASAGTPTSPLTFPPARVLALPSSPADGQEVYFVADAANGILWHLRYNAGSVSPYKWELVGGGGLSAYVQATEQRASTGTFADMTTAGPAVVIPLAGEYLCDYGAGYVYHSIAGVGTHVVPDGCGATANARVADSAIGAPDVANMGVQTSRNLMRLTLTVGALKLQYAGSGTSGTAFFGRRFISVIPLRVA